MPSSNTYPESRGATLSWVTPHGVERSVTECGGAVEGGLNMSTGGTIFAYFQCRNYVVPPALTVCQPLKTQHSTALRVGLPKSTSLRDSKTAKKKLKF